MNTSTPPHSQYMEDPPVPEEVLARIYAEMAERGEKPIDYVRRYAEAILARKGAFSKDQLAQQFSDFSIRYWRLFNMLCDDKFERRYLDKLFEQWGANMDGKMVPKATADKNTAYHAQSRPWGAYMGKAFVEPTVSRLPPKKDK